MSEHHLHAEMLWSQQFRIKIYSFAFFLFLFSAPFLMADPGGTYPGQSCLGNNNPCSNYCSGSTDCYKTNCRIYIEPSGDRNCVCDYYCHGSLVPGGPYGHICSPSCSGKTCGGDGCGGSCGTCAAGMTCAAGNCVAAFFEVMRVKCPAPMGEVRIAGTLHGSSSLKIQKNGEPYGVVMVPTGDPDASCVRIQMPGGPQALRKCGASDCS
jgi:hypothetical protein